MHLSKIAKILVGIVTLLPLFGIIYYFWWIFEMIGSILYGTGTTESYIVNFIDAMVVFVVGFLVGIASFVFYIVHVIKNKSFDNMERLMWILLFIFFPVISFIIYWIFKIWIDNGENDEEKIEKSERNFEI